MTENKGNQAFKASNGPPPNLMPPSDALEPQPNGQIATSSSSLSQPPPLMDGNRQSNLEHALGQPLNQGSPQAALGGTALAQYNTNTSAAAAVAPLLSQNN